MTGIVIFISSVLVAVVVAITYIAMATANRDTVVLDKELYASVVGWAKFIIADEGEVAENMRGQYLDMAKEMGVEMVEAVRLDLLWHNDSHPHIGVLARVLHDTQSFMHHVRYYLDNGTFKPFDGVHTKK